MSRGPGKLQLAILDALGRAPFVELRGATRSGSVGLARAARALERAGRCVVVRLWDDDHRAVRPVACRPDFTVDGKPVKEVSVAAVPHGTRATLTGSLRNLARKHKVSKTQVARDLALAARRESEGKPKGGKGEG